MTDELEQTNVVRALAAVMGKLPAIGKDGRAAPQQGGYAYRGIEQITQHAQGLLAEHGVVFCPNVLSSEVRDLVVNGKPWTDTTLHVRYDIYGPGGIEDRITVTTVGIGRDNSDKGANKALTQAFKYALIQVLCISDARDDADGQTYEADGAPPVARANEIAAFMARIAALPEDFQKQLRAQWQGKISAPLKRLPAAEVDDAEALISEYEHAAKELVST